MQEKEEEQRMTMVTFIHVLVGISVMMSLIFFSALIGDRVLSSAEQHGNELLLAVLTSEQSGQLSQLGYLDIPSPSNPQRIYRVPRARGRVKVIENGEVKASLCLQALESVPAVDMVVIHTLMIEADEDRYLQEANYRAIDSNA